LSEWNIFWDLVRNAAEIGFFIVVANYLHRYWLRLQARHNEWLTGVFFGFAGTISMLDAALTDDALPVDFRVLLVALACVFGSFRGGAAAAAVAVGTSFMHEGISMSFSLSLGSIVTGMLIGMAWHRSEETLRMQLSGAQHLAMGLVLGASTLAWTALLPEDEMLSYVSVAAMPVLLLYPMTVLVLRVIMTGHYRLPQHPVLEIVSMKNISHHLERFAGKSEHTTVIIGQIDNFKNVNDLHGASFGEQLLISMHQRLMEQLRHAVVFRLSMNEFLICVKQSSGDTAANMEVLKRTKKSLMNPYQQQGHDVSLLFTIGVANGSALDDSLESLIRQSETAMFEAKRTGSNVAVVYEPAMADRTVYHSQLQEALRYALARGEISLHLQPQFRTESSQLRGFEALVRWHHPRLGMISPAEFIPISEKNGTIIDIGRWVLEQACSIHHKELLPLYPNAYMSVNISAIQLGDPNFVSDVIGILKETGLPPERLELEITESGLMASVESAAESMQQLEKLGIRFALDDFGTGYSSLNYLQKFPIHLVKIDKSFIQELGGDKHKMTESIIHFVHMLDLPVVAEGLESDEQLTQLRSWRCDFVQGYLFSKPMPAKDAPDYIRRIQLA
jgi:diguanylate cyclase (GGDEF)-like protein